MSSPDVFGLGVLGHTVISTQGKRNTIRSFLPRMISEGLSGAASLRIFKEFGLGIRAQDFFAIRRDVLGLEEQANRVRFVRRDAIPSESIIPINPRPQRRQFQFIMAFNVFDPETGTFTADTTAFDSGGTMTREELETTTREKMEGDSPNLKGKIFDMTLIKAFRRS